MENEPLKAPEELKRMQSMLADEGKSADGRRKCGMWLELYVIRLFYNM